jgi:hypothetical protein
MKQHLVLTLFAMCLLGASSTSTVCMDSLDDNPAFLNTFFNERQEYLKQQTPAQEEPVVPAELSVVAVQKNIIDRWCDCKPIAAQSTTSQGPISDGAKEIFKFYVLGIILATFCHHLSA